VCEPVDDHNWPLAAAEYLAALWFNATDLG